MIVPVIVSVSIISLVVSIVLLVGLWWRTKSKRKELEEQKELEMDEHTSSQPDYYCEDIETREQQGSEWFVIELE